MSRCHFVSPFDIFEFYCVIIRNLFEGGNIERALKGDLICLKKTSFLNFEMAGEGYLLEITGKIVIISVTGGKTVFA